MESKTLDYSEETFEWTAEDGFSPVRHFHKNWKLIFHSGDLNRLVSNCLEKENSWQCYKYGSLVIGTAIYKLCCSIRKLWSLSALFGLIFLRSSNRSSLRTTRHLWSLSQMPKVSKQSLLVAKTKSNSCITFTTQPNTTETAQLTTTKPNSSCYCRQKSRSAPRLISY